MDCDKIHSMTRPSTLFTFEFVGCCLVAFLAVCNVSVFYNLFSYLQTLGVPPELRGVVVGSYSLTAMVLYLVAGPLLNTANAPRIILIGLTMMGASGLAYLFVHSFWGLMALRMFNGAGQFCTSGGVMALFVAVIPREKSGQAFGIYSAVIVLAYAGIPTMMDALAPFIRPLPTGMQPPQCRCCRQRGSSGGFETPPGAAGRRCDTEGFAGLGRYRRECDPTASLAAYPTEH